MSPRPALAAGLLAAVLATAGCGADIDVGDPEPSTAATTAPATTTAAPTTAAPTTDTATTPAATTGADPAGALPAAFPLPPGASVSRVVTEAGEISAVVAVPDGKQAYAFWTSALPGAGYTVVSAEMVGGIGEIRFTGPGCPGSSQIGVSGGDVAVQCTQR